MRVIQLSKWPMPRTKSGSDTENRRRFYIQLLKFGDRQSLWIGLYFIEFNITTFKNPSVGQKLFLLFLLLLPTISFAQTSAKNDSIQTIPMKLQSWSVQQIEANRAELKKLEPYIIAARQLEARNQEIILDVVRERQVVDFSTLVDFSLPQGTDTVRLYVRKPKPVKKP